MEALTSDGKPVSGADVDNPEKTLLSAYRLAWKENSSAELGHLQTRAFQIILAALVPLTHAQLVEALSVSHRPGGNNEDEVDDKGVEYLYLGLLEVDPNTLILRFEHNAARIFILEGMLGNEVAGEESKNNPFNKETRNWEMTQTCLSVLANRKHPLWASAGYRIEQDVSEKDALAAIEQVIACKKPPSYFTSAWLVEQFNEHSDRRLRGVAVTLQTSSFASYVACNTFEHLAVHDRVAPGEGKSAIAVGELLAGSESALYPVFMCFQAVRVLEGQVLASMPRRQRPRKWQYVVAGVPDIVLGLFRNDTTFERHRSDIRLLGHFNNAPDELLRWSWSHLVGDRSSIDEEHLDALILACRRDRHRFVDRLLTLRRTWFPELTQQQDPLLVQRNPNGFGLVHVAASRREGLKVMEIVAKHAQYHPQPRPEPCCQLEPNEVDFAFLTARGTADWSGGISPTGCTPLQFACAYLIKENVESLLQQDKERLKRMGDISLANLPLIYIPAHDGTLPLHMICEKLQFERDPRIGLSCIQSLLHAEREFFSRFEELPRCITLLNSAAVSGRLPVEYLVRNLWEIAVVGDALDLMLEYEAKYSGGKKSKMLFVRNYDERTALDHLVEVLMVPWKRSARQIEDYFTTILRILIKYAPSPDLWPASAFHRRSLKDMKRLLDRANKEPSVFSSKALEALTELNAMFQIYWNQAEHAPPIDFLAWSPYLRAVGLDESHWNNINLHLDADKQRAYHQKEYAKAQGVDVEAVENAWK